MTAVAEQTGAWLEHFTSQPAAARAGCRRCARPPSRASPELGFPTTHDEEWRFTNVAPIARNARFRSGRPVAGADRLVSQRPS